MSWSRAIVAALLCAALCGCASAGRKIDSAKVDQIKKGETTREQVLKLMGPPNQITKNSAKLSSISL